MNCSLCNSFSLTVGRSRLTCNTCGCVEEVEIALLRCVEELKILFPEKKITTSCLFEWCGGGIVSAKLIRRVLNKNFAIIGKNRFAHFM